MLHPRLYCETEKNDKKKISARWWVRGGDDGDGDGDPLALSIFFREIN